jgi:hypothetical protein
VWYNWTSRKDNSTMETNTDYTNFFEDVVDRLTKANDLIIEAKSIIGNTGLVKKPTKNVLIGRIDNMLAESDAIWNKLAILGKVK